MDGNPTTSELMDAIIDLHAAVGTGFERLEGRFEVIERTLADVRGEVAGLQRWMAQSEGRLGVLEIGMTEVRGEVKGLQGWMMQSDRRFAVLEQRL